MNIHRGIRTMYILTTVVSHFSWWFSSNFFYFFLVDKIMRFFQNTINREISFIFYVS